MSRWKVVVIVLVLGLGIGCIVPAAAAWWYTEKPAGTIVQSFWDTIEETLRRE